MPHIHEKVDFTVEVFIVYEDKVLLRKHDKYDIWLGVGGHIEPDEDPNEAALREVREEVGLKITLAGAPLPEWTGLQEEKELIPPRFLNRHRINSTHEHVSLVYFAKADTYEVVPGAEDKSDEWRWLTREELEENKYIIKENILFYAKEALKELGA